MADFCSICTAKMVNLENGSENIGDILTQHLLLRGGDFNIEEIFKEHILPDIQDFLAEEKLGILIPGICEHCGLSQLHMKKEADKVYLVAWCWKPGLPKETGKYKIAEVIDNELVYQEDECQKLFNEH